MEDTKLCSKKGCEELRADPDSNNPWCKKHRAEYQRAYQSTKLEMESGKGFGKGVQAMRELLADQFAQQGSAGFSGYEISALIAQCPGPSAKD
jgi:hypothetical protein